MATVEVKREKKEYTQINFFLKGTDVGDVEVVYKIIPLGNKHLLIRDDFTGIYYKLIEEEVLNKIEKENNDEKLLEELELSGTWKVLRKKMKMIDISKYPALFPS